ncbi:MAG TPA: hypothetical protein VFJ02_02195 [Vicinamibacterales bacterium]|nr:hypothetical protein [Vicinamibacterales bacterium]
MRSYWRLFRRRVRAQGTDPLHEARLTVERARAAFAALPTERQRSLTAALLRAIGGKTHEYSR